MIEYDWKQDAGVRDTKLAGGLVLNMAMDT